MTYGTTFGNGNILRENTFKVICHRPQVEHVVALVRRGQELCLDLLVQLQGGVDEGLGQLHDRLLEVLLEVPAHNRSTPPLPPRD